MKTKLPILAVILFAALFFASCSKDSVSSGDVQVSVDGPNSIKGTFTGKMIDSTKTFTFNYDYHVTTSDGNSGNEAYIDSDTGDTLIYVWQYFYFDRNGYDDYGDTYSTSGQYIYLYFQAKVSTVNKSLVFTQVPVASNSYQAFEGMWQNLTSNKLFVYYIRYNAWYNGQNTPPVVTYSNLKYDEGSQSLTGSVNVDVPSNTDANVNTGNHNPSTITGDFKLYFPKQQFQVIKTGSSFVYRTRGH